MPSAATKAAADAPMAEPKRRSRTSGIDRILQILDFLQAIEKPATAYEIAHGIGAPLSTIYTIVEDLVGKNLLLRQKDGSLWLGPRLYYYGLTYSRRLDLLGVANAEMHELSQKSGETVQICGRDNDMMVVLAMEEGRDHFQVTSRVGTRTPLNWTASGRLLVGHLAQNEQVDIFTRCAKNSPTGRAEIDPVTLSQKAAQALANRLSIQAGESDFSVACIASPICNPQGECLATISIVVPDIKVNQSEPDLVGLVKESAKRIESRLGWA
ncbi:IclR family transcriptional regulator [Thalassospira marina]|uniref:IclR family transcriptional regulator n=1 Tax=Thalassospira marina TaxID=2048283 RepID=A0A2N3KEP5_9PROT|nr:IclR family transcriptional regulator [Thalassospira marina]AUG55362.1 IclR family transcriptional regulator [Thalassospira marina]PKR49021.1 IclR family transcriptional regulator [Thalassospira marina]